MIKYKCVKRYPAGSGKQWEVGDICDGKGTKATHDEAPNFPEFWEKVEEKDYEILSFKQNSDLKDLFTNFGSNINIGCWCRNINGKAITSGYTTEDILESDLYSIYSIKRLSDGEVFTVGDSIDIGHNKNNIIDSFELCDYGIRVKVRRNTNCRVYGAKLSIIKAYKKPLFVTEDGVDIYEGDKSCAVQISENKLYGYDSHNYMYKYNGSEKSFMYFSTKKLALKYIESKKILFVTEDGVNMFKGDNYWYVSDKDFDIGNFPAISRTLSYTSKAFSTKKAAEIYAKENKPKYSEKDMLNFAHFRYMQQGGGMTVNSRIALDFKNWRQKQNDRT